MSMFDVCNWSQMQESPYKYDSHVRLIELLRSADSREMLRESRETMNKYFPLSPGERPDCPGQTCCTYRTAAVLMTKHAQFIVS